MIRIFTQHCKLFLFFIFLSALFFQENVFAAESITVKLRDLSKKNYTDIRIYYWGTGITSPGWPGNSGELVNVGDSWYSYTFDSPAESVNVIFTFGNGNGTAIAKTENIENILANACFSISENGFYHHNGDNVDIYTAVPIAEGQGNSSVKIQWEHPTVGGWGEEMYIFSWANTDVILPGDLSTWPGEKVTKNED